MTVTQTQISYGQLTIAPTLKANFDEIVRVVDNGN